MPQEWKMTEFVILAAAAPGSPSPSAGIESRNPSEDRGSK